jgi:hypothetical protein
MALWTDKKLFDRIFDRLAQGKRKYVKFNAARDNIVEYLRPDLGADLSPDGDGSFFGSSSYEGTGPWAVGVMSRGFQGGLVSAEADWITHMMKQSELRGLDELDIWLQNIKDHITGVYQQSNFYRVLPSFTKDGITIGSPLMFIEEDLETRTIQFLPQHYKTVVAFYDKFNRLEGVIIEDEKWTTKHIFDKFAPSIEEAEKKLSKSVNNEIKEGHFHKEHTIIRAVFKNTDPIWKVPGFKKPDRKWISVYFEQKTEEDRKNTPLESLGYFSRPMVVWDYDKKPWESVSRTPAFDAIYDVIGHTDACKEQLENWKLKNRPPRGVLADHRNIMDFGPEGLTEVEKGDWEFLPKMIDVIGDIRISREELEASAERIKRWFHTDKFMKFTDLTTTLKQQPTATQIIKMAAEIAVQVTPAVVTYTGGFLQGVDERVIEIESRAGRGPFDPQTMENISDIVLSNVKSEIDRIQLIPIFVGPLARAQKVKQELDPILDGLFAARESGLFEMDEDLVHAIRGHNTLEDIFAATGFPLKNFVPEDEFKVIKEALIESRQQEKQLLMAAELAKASQSVSGPVDESSILASTAG